MQDDTARGRLRALVATTASEITNALLRTTDLEKCTYGGTEQHKLMVACQEVLSAALKADPGNEHLCRKQAAIKSNLQNAAIVVKIQTLKTEIDDWTSEKSCGAKQLKTAFDSCTGHTIPEDIVKIADMKWEMALGSIPTLRFARVHPQLFDGLDILSKMLDVGKLQNA